MRQKGQYLYYLRVPVPPGADETTIVDRATEAVGMTNLSQSLPYWHRLFFGVPPTVILKAYPVISASQTPADLYSACRTLVKTHELRVVVDATPGATPAEVAYYNDNLMELMEVGAMSREALEQVTGLAGVHKALRAAGIADVVWAVLGGNPSQYAMLQAGWKERHGGNITAAAGAHLTRVLLSAISALDVAVAEYPARAPLFDMFATQDAVPSLEEGSRLLPRRFPDTVLRLTALREDSDLHWVQDWVPISPAMALVLRHKLTFAPSLTQLAAILSPVPGAAAVPDGAASRLA